jgi:hypothetical protein
VCGIHICGGRIFLDYFFPDSLLIRFRMEAQGKSKAKENHASVLSGLKGVECRIKAPWWGH